MTPQRCLSIGLYGLGGLLAISGLVFFIGTPAANNPTLCGRICHSMNPAYQSWSKSSHAKLNCRECHISSSYAEISEEKIVQTTVRLWLTLTDSYSKPVDKDSHYSQKEMPMERCERCHRNANRRFTTSEGITMDHPAHRRAQIPCAVCHNRVAHPRAEQFEPIASTNKGFEYKDLLTMKQGCWRCHSSSNLFREADTLRFIKNNKAPPSDCRVCHNRDFPFPEGHTRSNWRSTHASTARANFPACLGCHAPGKKFDNRGRLWCTLCHEEKNLLRELRA